jgi:predicted nucleic acid-binding protein
VLYEWLRGPRVPREVAIQEALLPSDRALPFGPEEAAEAAHLCANLPRARGREVDLAIAACAITWNAELWTLNLGDFDDIPGLKVRLPG